MLLGLRIEAYSPFTVYPCTVEFPKTLKKVPEICIYHGGERFIGEVDTTGRRACFNLPIEKSCTHFNLLVIEELQFESEKNTIQYLKIDTKQPYKYYTMELVRASRKRYVPSDRKNQESEPDRWIIRSGKVSPDGRIPDETIIVLLNANYVERVEGSNGFELPTIFIKENIVEIAGSEQRLHDKSVEMILSSLDYNPIHVNTKIATRCEGEHRFKTKDV
jgi:hypothetical protein